MTIGHCGPPSGKRLLGVLADEQRLQREHRSRAETVSYPAASIKMAPSWLTLISLLQGETPVGRRVSTRCRALRRRTPPAPTTTALGAGVRWWPAGSTRGRGGARGLLGASAASREDAAGASPRDATAAVDRRATETYRRTGFQSWWLMVRPSVRSEPCGPFNNAGVRSRPRGGGDGRRVDRQAQEATRKLPSSCSG